MDTSPNLAKYSYWAKRSDGEVIPSVKTSNRQPSTILLEYELTDDSGIRYSMEVNRFLAEYQWLYND